VIWLWSNLWWLVPVLVIGAGLAHPIPRALLRRVPVRAWAILGVFMLLGLTFQLGRWYERSTVREKEVKADVKAAKVVTESKTRVGTIRKTTYKESADAVANVEAAVAALPDTCPALPDSVRESVQRQVEAARDGVSESAGSAHP